MAVQEKMVTYYQGERSKENQTTCQDLSACKRKLWSNRSNRLIGIFLKRIKSTFGGRDVHHSTLAVGLSPRNGTPKNRYHKDIQNKNWMVSRSFETSNYVEVANCAVLCKSIQLVPALRFCSSAFSYRLCSSNALSFTTYWFIRWKQIHDIKPALHSSLRQTKTNAFHCPS